MLQMVVKALASLLLHFTTVYLFYCGKRLLDRSFLPWNQTSNATDMSTMYPYANHHTIPSAFIH